MGNHPFSYRTNWLHQPNKLSQCLNRLRKEGKTIIDLTISNPTQCDIVYPESELLSAFSNRASLQYEPDPKGLICAREAVRDYYACKNIAVNTANIFLTASTSESYSILFKLICNNGDNILVPKPSYPLFDYLAQLNDVELEFYHLRYAQGWHIDIDSIMNAVNNKTKAIVLINPHNPTGMYIKKDEYNAIKKIAVENNLVLIIDEVFLDYSIQDNDNNTTSICYDQGHLTFTMNGISKMVGLPMMKLGWIVVNGPIHAVNEALARLEIICDTFLSVNMPVQVAFPNFLRVGKNIYQQILDRVRSNYSMLKCFTSNTKLSLLSSEGGWCGILRAPRIKSDEEWALQLLESKYVYVLPGYFFDFQDDGYLVLSLLTESGNLQRGLNSILSLVDEIV